MKIDIRSNVKEFTKGLDRIAKKQMPYATSKAINAVANKAEKEIKKQIQTLDNPVSFTVKGTFVKMSNKNNKPITAIVGVKDKQATYLEYMEEGGVSRAKGKAKPIPANIAKNAYGNLARGTTKRIGNGKVFSGTPRGGRPGGIYQRMGGKRNPKLRQLAHWAPASKHTPKMRVGARVRIAVDRNFSKELAKQLASAMR